MTSRGRTKASKLKSSAEKTNKNKNENRPLGARRREAVAPPFSLAAPLLFSSENDSDSKSSARRSITADDVLEGVANLLAGKKNIVVLVGAGISTSVGIPDFRSRDKGLYNTLDAAALGLSCPEDLFCIEFFRDDPSPFYKFATQLYYPNQQARIESKTKSSIDNKNNNNNNNNNKSNGTQRKSRRLSLRSRSADESTTTTTSTESPGTARASDSHKLLALLEKHKMLLRVYTQNIDGLESSAGVSDSKIVYCHGSLRSMSCTRCSRKKIALTPRILESIAEGRVPLCGAEAKQRSAGAAGSAGGSAGAGESSAVLRSPTRTSQRTRKRPRSLVDCDAEGTETEGNGNRDSDNNNSDNNNANNRENNVCGGVLKPGITFFGETLDHSVGRKIESDQAKADALIVIGTSLSVAPISKVIEYLPPSIPRILINRSIVHPRTQNDNDKDKADDDEKDFRTNYVFDAYLLGFCDDVTRALAKQMGLGFDVGQGNAETEPRKATAKAKAKPKRGKNATGSASPTTRGETGREKPPTGNASATAAKLLPSVATAESSLSSAPLSSSPSSSPSTSGGEWSSVTVPRERVILFPGALDTSDDSNDNDNNDNEREAYHEVAHCDGCSCRIPKGRPVYKCLDCFDYDLCQKCYPKVSKRHGGGKHTFRRE